MSSLHGLLLLVGLWVLSTAIRILRRRAKTTQLKGPASKSLIFGVSRFVREHDDPGLKYEEWAEQYGAVFRMPMAFGATKILLCDPKAIQHFYSRETYGYNRNAMARIFLDDMVFIDIRTRRNEHAESEC